MKNYSYRILVLLPVLLSCGGYHSYPSSPNVPPQDSVFLSEGDSLAVQAILVKNSIQHIPVRRVIRINDGRAIALKLIRTDYTFQYLGPTDAIDSLPSDISALNALETLLVWDQPLKMLPSEIGDLASLRKIHIERCSLEIVPDQLTVCSLLSEIYLPNNAIRKMPDSLHRLRNAQIIVLRNNQLDSLPKEIGRMGLYSLNVSSNRLNTLPDGITGLTTLGRDPKTSEYFLDLSRNRLCDMPGSIADWANLYDPDWELTQQCGLAQNQHIILSIR